MLKGPNQNLLINRICPNPLMFLQGVIVPLKSSIYILSAPDYFQLLIVDLQLKIFNVIENSCATMTLT